MKEIIRKILNQTTFTDEEVAFLADHVNLVIEVAEEN